MPNLSLFWFLWVVLCQLPAVAGADALTAEHAAQPSLHAQVVADARDGSWDDFSLLSAALIAGGVEQPAALDEYCRRFAEISARSQQRVPNGQPENSSIADHRQRVANLLQFMHQHVLTGGYQIDASQVDRTLASGAYNCVTATMLFNCLCAEHGLRARAVAVRGHVFSRVEIPGLSEAIEVQTTSPLWFEQVGEDREQTVQPEPERDLSPVQLVAKIYYNRAVGELGRGDFAAAVDALEQSLLLDPADAAARENLLAAFNNWSLRECRSRNFRRAVELWNRGASIDADYEPLRANDLYIHQQWAVSLCRENRHQDALRLLEQGYARRPQAELFELGRFAVCSQWAESLFRRGHLQDAWQVLSDARRRFGNYSHWASYEAQSILAAADECARRDDVLEATRLLEHGLQLQPANQQLKARLRGLERHGV